MNYSQQQRQILGATKGSLRRARDKKSMLLTPSEQELIELQRIILI